MAESLNEQDRKNILMLANKQMLLVNKKFKEQLPDIDIPEVRVRVVGKVTVYHIDPIVIVKPTDHAGGSYFKLELWVSDFNILYNFARESVADISQIDKMTNVIPFLPKQENTDVTVIMSKIKNDCNIAYWLSEIKKEARSCVKKKGKR